MWEDGLLSCCLSAFGYKKRELPTGYPALQSDHDSTPCNVESSFLGHRRTRPFDKEAISMMGSGLVGSLAGAGIAGRDK